MRTDRIRAWLAATALTIAGTGTLLAIPASPDPITFTQPDGSTIMVRLVGDEHAHRYLSLDGYLLTHDADGFFTYATRSGDEIVSSGVRAHDLSQRPGSEISWLVRSDANGVLEHATAIDKTRREAKMQKLTRLRRPAATRADGDEFECSQLRFDNAYPAQGSPKALIILVQYPDKAFADTEAYEYFNGMINTPGFSENNATGSVYDYFNHNSKGRFIPDFDVYGPVMLPKVRSAYGGNDSNGDDKDPAGMIVDACRALDDKIDFSQYDTDGDGYVDNIYVFYAGMGEADSRDYNAIWPHSWNVETGAGKICVLDGVHIDRYACSNEIDGQTGLREGIGTFVHEFSHVMGLPDLYDIFYSSNTFTPGSWSVLDYGPYNNGGHTPPNYGAFERYAMGWQQPRRFDFNGEIIMPPIQSDVFFKVDTERPTEFFLVEKRERTDWDKYVPFDGMLVWYIDYDYSAWNRNSVNTDAARQRVNIIEADNRPLSSDRDGDCFPGIYGITSFTTSTTPAFRCRLGKPVGVEFTDIYMDDHFGDLDYVYDPHEPLYITVKSDIGNAEPPTFDGVHGVSADATWSLCGRELTADADTETYSIDGRLIGRGSLTLPQGGIYLVREKGHVSKILVK